MHNDALELPEPLKAMRRMISGTDNPAKLFWESATKRERENLIFFCRPRLGNTHVSWSWREFDFNKRQALLNGLFEMRRLHEKTSAFRPDHFNCSVLHVCTDPIPELRGERKIYPKIN